MESQSKSSESAGMTDTTGMKSNTAGFGEPVGMCPARLFGANQVLVQTTKALLRGLVRVLIRIERMILIIRYYRC